MPPRSMAPTPSPAWSTSLPGATSDRLYYGLRVEADPANPDRYRCIDPGVRAQGCVPINPFAPYMQDQIDYLTLDAGQHGISTLHDFNALMSKRATASTRAFRSVPSPAN